MIYTFDVEFNLSLKLTTTLYPYVYVVDSDGHKVNVYHSETGAFLFSFGGYGTENGKFIYPKGISLYKNKLYITDSGNKRVQIFNLNGTFLKSILLPTMGLPYGIYVDEVCIGISDYQLHKIFFYSTDTEEYLWEFGGYGSGDGQFINPTNIINNGIYFIVVDEGNQREIVYYKFDFWMYYSFANIPIQVNTYSLFIKNPSLSIMADIDTTSVTSVSFISDFTVNSALYGDTTIEFAIDSYSYVTSILDFSSNLQYSITADIFTVTNSSINIPILFDIFAYFETINTEQTNTAICCNLLNKSVTTFSFPITNLSGISEIDGSLILVGDNIIFNETNSDFDIYNTQIPIPINILLHDLYLDRLTKVKTNLVKILINDSSGNNFSFEIQDNYGNIGVYNSETGRVKIGRGFIEGEYKLRIKGNAPMYLKRISLNIQAFSLRRR